MSLDHDGDAITTNIFLGAESNAEVAEYFDKPMSMVDANSRLIYGLSSGRLVRYSVRSATAHELSTPEK